MGRVAALARALRRDRIDIVHNYLLRANLVGSISARLARVPVVLCSKRGCHERRGFELVGAKIGNALADSVTVNADAVRDFVHGNEGCPREKMVVIPSGVDTDRFQPLRAGAVQGAARPARGSAGRRRGDPHARAQGRRGVHSRHRRGARDASRRARRHRRRGQLGRRAASAGAFAAAREHLSLLGRRSDMPEVFSAFDVFVLSSHDEGMSNAILEAMAMEKPVVATDVGGTGEVVRHGHSGLLVPPKDPHALGSGHQRGAGAAGACPEMGRLGRRIVEEGFSAHAMVRQMEQLYLDLAAARGVAAGQAGCDDGVSEGV